MTTKDIDLDRSNRRIRVLQIFGGPLMGGIENQALAFVERYNRDNFIVDVCCTQSVEGPLRDRFLAAGPRLLSCPWSKHLVPFVVRLTKLLRAERYDVVHARMSEVSGTAMLAARLAKVPLRIASYHHTQIWEDPSLSKRVAVTALQNLTRRYAHKIIGITQAVLDTYFDDWREQSDQLSVCYNGIDMESFLAPFDRIAVRDELGIAKDALVVGHVGRFAKPKNHATFIYAAAILAKRMDRARFLLVGDGDLRGDSEARVAKLALTDRFVFVGSRSDVPRMLSAMDAFLLPSVHEGLGSVAIEAQAAGVPVIASNLPAIAEALCPPMRALSCDPLDAEVMADRLYTLLADLETRQKLGIEGRKFVLDNFSIQRTVAQLERIYSER